MPTILQRAALKLRDEFLLTGTHKATVKVHSGLCSLIAQLFKDGALSHIEVQWLERAIAVELRKWPHPEDPNCRYAYLTSGWLENSQYGLTPADRGEPAPRYKARLAFLSDLVLGYEP